MNDTAGERAMTIAITMPLGGSVGYVHFDCPKNPKHQCYVPIREGEQKGLTWGWNGDVGSPTIEPSINCHQCGWHGHIIEGKTV